MGIDERVLVFGDELNHLIHRLDLVKVQRCVDGRPLVRILVKQRIDRIQVLLLPVVQQVADGSPVERHVRHKTLQAKLQEHLEEDQGSWLLSHK